MRTAEERRRFLEAAKTAYNAGAEAARKHAADDGTCNLDYVVLYMRCGSKDAVSLLGLAGFRAYLRKRGEVHISTPFGGQAMQWTAAVEAISAALNEAQIDDMHAYVRYVMD